MIDTYRRLKKSFSRNIKFRENKKVMVLQIYMITFHTCCEFALALTLEISVDTKRLDDNSNLIASLKILLVIVLFITQTVLFYLLDQFSRPIKLDKLKDSFESSKSGKSKSNDYDEEEDSDTPSSAFGNYISDNIKVLRPSEIKKSFGNDYRQIYLDEKTSSQKSSEEL